MCAEIINHLKITKKHIALHMHTKGTPTANYLNRNLQINVVFMVYITFTIHQGIPYLPIINYTAPKTLQFTAECV